MPFQLSEVSESDFPELITCMWESYESPPQDLFRLFCPILGAGPDARAESIKESTERFCSWHVSDPTSYWHKVVDIETGKIVAAALWKIHKTNPYDKAEHHEAYWHPEGGQREFVTKALEQFEAPKERMANRPHLYLNIIFTHPNYRLQGAARMILMWGIAKAEELNVEMWLDGWVYGAPVYKRFGFTVVEENRLKPTTAVPDADWRRMEQSLTDLTLWVMWRPQEGPYLEGKSIRPWES